MHANEQNGRTGEKTTAADAAGEKRPRANERRDEVASALMLVHSTAFAFRWGVGHAI